MAWCCFLIELWTQIILHHYLTECLPTWKSYSFCMWKVVYLALSSLLMTWQKPFHQSVFPLTTFFSSLRRARKLISPLWYRRIDRTTSTVFPCYLYICLSVLYFETFHSQWIAWDVFYKILSILWVEHLNHAARGMWRNPQCVDAFFTRSVKKAFF